MLNSQFCYYLMFCLVFMFSCVFRVFEEKKVFLESSMLKGQFRRKLQVTRSNTSTQARAHQHSSVAEQGSSTDVLDRTSHRIKRICTRSHKHPILSVPMLECRRATIDCKHALERTTLGSSAQMRQKSFFTSNWVFSLLVGLGDWPHYKNPDFY